MFTCFLWCGVTWFISKRPFAIWCFVTSWTGRVLQVCWTIEKYVFMYISLYRDVWIAAIASSRTRLATLTGAMCKTSQCELRSLRVNSGMLNVIRIVTYYPIRVARLFLDCNGDFAIKAYGTHCYTVDIIKSKICCLQFRKLTLVLHILIDNANMWIF